MAQFNEFILPSSIYMALPLAWHADRQPPMERRFHGSFPACLFLGHIDYIAHLMNYDGMKSNSLTCTSWIAIFTLAAALCACGTGTGDSGPDAGIDAALSCPPEPPSGDCEAPPFTLSCSYGADQGGPTDCYCLSGSWQCTSCPGDFADPDATCTPGDTCGWLDWEHGCSCQCNDQGRWQCTPDTIGSVCPTGLPDAGP